MSEPINDSSAKPSTERTPLVIAAEINRIKQETCKIMLTNAIEVGKRLKEAKALLPHGEWGKWLVESVSYSQRTANKLMQLFAEYGDSNSPAQANLSYYQALLLLGIPEEEREEFILQHNVEAMTTRELEQALKERKQSDPEQEQPQVTPTPNHPQDLQIEHVTVQKTNKPKSTPKTEASQAFTLKYEETCTASCQTIADAFQKLLEALNQLAGLDPKVKEKCQKNASKLAEYMVESLKEWPPIVKYIVG